MKATQRLLVGTLAALLIAILPSACSRAGKIANKLSAAKQYVDQGNDPAAEIEFKNVLAAKPDNPAALKGIGMILVRQGAMLDAARALTTAKAKLPTDDEVGVALGRALLALDFTADSRKELLEVLGRSPACGEALMLLAESSLTEDDQTVCAERIAKAKADDHPPVMLASALIELRRGHLEAGSKLVDRAVAADPKFARALALQGNLFKGDKQPEKALATLKTASDLAGPRSNERGFYALLLAEQGHQDEALALLKEATQTSPDYLPNWRLLARLNLAAGKTDEAAENLSKVLAKSPLDIEAGLLQSQLWLRQNDPAKAVKQLETLVSTFPSRPHLELALGNAYLAAEDFRKAADQLDRVLIASPGAIDAILLRAAIFLKDGQPAEVIRLVEPLHAAEPANRSAQDILVAAYRAANRPDDAAAILHLQLEARPNEVDPQLQLGQILASQGKLAEARTLLERVQGIAPDQLGAVSQLAALDEREGKTDQALARIDAYLAAHPQSPQALLLKANCCFSRKDYQAAELAANKAIELKPDDPTPYGLLVRIQIIGHHAEEAVAQLKQLLAASPSNLSALMYLGTLQRELAHPAEARHCFEEMLKINPKLASAYNDLACLDATHPEQLDKARENARKAHSLSPDDPAINDTCGWIEWLRGDYRQALPFLIDSAAHLPGNATVQYHLAMTRYMMHQIPEATAAFEAALARLGDTPDKAQATARLATLHDGAQWDIATIDQRLKDTPNDVVLMVLKAAKLAASQHPDDAARTYQDALAINPELEFVYLKLAELYNSDLKQPDKAFEAASQARKVAPQSPQVAAALGSIEFHRAKYQDAYSLLQEAARKLPADPRVQADFAWAAYSLGRVADARAIMAKLASGDPPLAADAKDFLALTDPAATANPDTRALVDKKPADSSAGVPALMVKAALQEKAGDNPQASYAKVLEIFPQFDPARLALARIYLNDPPNLDAAEKLANDARERLRDDPDLSGILATINFRKGNFDYAAQLLSELSAKRQLTGPELFALGMSQAATKRPADAQQSLTRALQSKLPDADAAKAKTTLDTLDKPADNHHH